MTKERQIQIMKPIKVLSLVLLALLLLVPAASAETYTLIDEDLEFGGGSGGSVGSISGVSTPLSSEVYSSPSTIPPVNLNSGQLRVYLWDEYCSTHDNFILSVVLEDGSFLSVELPIDEEHLYQNPNSAYSIYSYRYVDYFPVPTYSSGILFVGDVLYSNGDVASELLDNFAYDSENIGYCEYYWLYPNNLGGFSRPSGIQNIIVSPSDSLAPSTQHVTVTYTEESENYQIYVDTSDESVDVWVHGYIFGWFPVYTFSSNSFPPSTHFEWLDLPFQFLLWNIDWEVKVECDGESQVLKWNQDSLPIDVTPPEPDPPFEPDLPDEPDPPDPTEPPEEPPNPPWYNPSGGEGGGGSFDGQTFRETFKLPESLLDLLNFDLKQIRSDLLADIPIFEDIAVGWFDATDGLQNVFFGFIAGILVTFFKPLTDLFEWLSDVAEWFYNLCFGFTDYLYIPNHVLSYLVQFVPNEILNLASLLFALDIVVGLLSILIPDIRYVYNVAVSHAKPRISVRDVPPSQPYLGTELDTYHSEYWGDSYIEGHNYDYHQDVTEDGLNYEWRYK